MLKRTKQNSMNDLKYAVQQGCPHRRKKHNLEGRNFKMIEEKREFKQKTTKKLYVINRNPSKRQISGYSGFQEEKGEGRELQK